jgi:hypothetical protein
VNRLPLVCLPLLPPCPIQLPEALHPRVWLVRPLHSARSDSRHSRLVHFHTATLLMINDCVMCNMIQKSLPNPNSYSNDLKYRMLTVASALAMDS